MMKAKKILGVLFIVVALACVMAVSASAVNSFNKETGELIISEPYIDLREYKKRTDIKSVVIHEGVTRLTYEAFRGCTNLESVILPESLTIIEEAAFAECKKLTKIYIPKNVSRIDHFAFGNCTSLKELTVPASFFAQNMMMVFDESPIEKLTVIGEGTATFDESNLPTDHLQEVIIESGIKFIGRFAFSGCKNLSSISLNDGIVRIEESAFSGCSNLKEISIPDSVYYIVRYAFSNCNNLSNVELPDSIASINEYTFSGCSNLKNISIPNSVASIGEYAFNECAFSDFKIPDKIKRIQKGTFRYCRQLKNISLDNIEYIGDHAFYQSGLTDVVIPEECNYIGEGAFNSSSLKNITIQNDNVEIGEYAIWNDYAKVTIYASCGSAAHNYTLVVDPYYKKYYQVIFVSTKHQLNDEWYYDSATCSSKGIKYKKCIYCSEQTDIEITSDVLPHDYKDFVIYSATCTMTGTKQVTCYNCGNSYSETIPATGHDFEGSKCKNCPFDRATECSCNCHAGGIKTFFFNIINFFQKIFGQNKICTCGAKH